MFNKLKLTAIPALLILAACATPEDQREANCVGATVAGALVGGFVGNQLGDGSGNTLLTAAGAATGGAITASQTGCIG